MRAALQERDAALPAARAGDDAAASVARHAARRRSSTANGGGSAAGGDAASWLDGSEPTSVEPLPRKAAAAPPPPLDHAAPARSSAALRGNAPPLAAADAGIEPAPASRRDARALLVICYNRPDYLRRTLASVLSRLPTYNRPHVYVSQDGNDVGVAAVIDEYRQMFAQKAVDIPFTHLHHKQDPANAARTWGGYYALAQHFGWALNSVFGDGGHPNVIVLEDDLEIAVDFFDYFSAMEPLLHADRSLLAASAWSDIGQPQYVRDPSRVLRSDFFPGLGWMLTRHTWEELGEKWPDSFWDDWLREPPQRKGRAFLRPEISRTYTFGQQGVSQAQFFAQYLGNIKLNDAPVDWASQDFTYLGKAIYDRNLQRDVEAARELSQRDIVAASCASRDDGSVEDLKVYYSGFDAAGGYSPLARDFGFIDDVKAGVPRGAYNGVSIIQHNGCRKLIVHS